MGYTPYKMVGHTLPGIKQRKPAVAKMKAFGTKTLEGPKKTDTNPGSGLNYTSGVGSSPAKGWLKNLGKKIGGGAKKLFGKTLVGNALGIGKDKGGGKGGFGNIKEMDARISALEEGAGASAGGGDETAMAGSGADRMKMGMQLGNPTGMGGGTSKMDMIKPGGHLNPEGEATAQSAAAYKKKK